MPKPLVVFEIANNHQGDLQHGLRIIREFSEVAAPFATHFDFGFKLQYRDLDTFIRPDAPETKHVKRFRETRLSADEHQQLVDAIRAAGCLTVCTPFDEPSVDLIEQHGISTIKVASCSIADWPLLERIAKANLPVIASTGGATLEEIDHLVAFFTHREIPLSLLHCVAEYPTPNEYAQLDRIDLLRQRYANIPIGWSTHEERGSTELVSLALAKGATILEKHVGIWTEQYPLNNYSTTPAQIEWWLRFSTFALKACHGEKTDIEHHNLHALKRGMIAAVPIPQGKRIVAEDVRLAFPLSSVQYDASMMSKYIELTATEDISEGSEIGPPNASVCDRRSIISDILGRVKEVIRASHVVVPKMVDFELSHHYGIDRFSEFGSTIIPIVNREYCKKLIVMLPGQTHPEQYHKFKEETFHVLYGLVLLRLKNPSYTEDRWLVPGNIVTIERGVRHSFTTHNDLLPKGNCTNSGCVIEEISSHHAAGDSYYTDPQVHENRKTYVMHWTD